MVKSAVRIIEILELFDRLQRPLTLSEIADTLGYPRSSTMGLLQSLRAMDYMAFDDEEKHYTPTNRVALLGGWLHGRVFQDGVIVGLMNQLQRESGETVMLALQNGMHAQYVHTVQSQDLLRFYLRPGMLRPICRSAVGLALLAQQSPERVRRLVERINEQQIDPSGPVSYPALSRTLDSVRTQGYAYSDAVTEDACAIAIVLPSRRGQPATALGVSGPTRRLGKQKEAMYRLMKELAVEHLSARFPLRRPVK
ncbi:IclR family transcriptional regulator [Cupriavidus sp. IK-TO18]|uniref:IclR family transcriptional regulator n=1 Tax=Cupriavidus sp. IK-TO18 TaxID=2782182 RepID=UPI00189824A0|nr:IclR family transcriptional regulator [Cupriavidus sp. IK-TO18]MBF6989160.1 IclR family transcriptional regulator [Cupriavidus sp. IK-TO18]